MLKYIESEKYKRNKHAIHFILIGIALAVIIIGVLVYFS